MNWTFSFCFCPPLLKANLHPWFSHRNRANTTRTASFSLGTRLRMFSMWKFRNIVNWVRNHSKLSEGVLSCDHCICNLRRRGIQFASALLLLLNNTICCANKKILQWHFSKLRYDCFSCFACWLYNDYYFMLTVQTSALRPFETLRVCRRLHCEMSHHTCSVCLFPPAVRSLVLQVNTAPCANSAVPVRTEERAITSPESAPVPPAGWYDPLHNNTD